MAGELTLILGPMKSGKSFELINHFAPLKFTDIKFILYQNMRNVRDNYIWSRNGVEISAHKVPSIECALGKDFEVIGMDEAHMFPPSDAAVVGALLRRGSKVIASGLDTDYKGEMFEVIRRLLELGPKEVIFRRAVCDICKKLNATYTQVLHGQKPIVEGIPSVNPDNGIYNYMAVCRNCFVKKSD